MGLPELSEQDVVAIQVIRGDGRADFRLRLSLFVLPSPNNLRFPYFYSICYMLDRTVRPIGPLAPYSLAGRNLPKPATCRQWQGFPPADQIKLRCASVLC